MQCGLDALLLQQNYPKRAFQSPRLVAEYLQAAVLVDVIKIAGDVGKKQIGEGIEQAAGQRNSLFGRNKLVEYYYFATFFEHPLGFTQAGYGVGNHSQNQVQHHGIELLVGKGELLTIHHLGMHLPLPNAVVLRELLEHGRSEVGGSDVANGREIWQVEARTGTYQQHLVTFLELKFGDGALPGRIKKPCNKVVNRTVQRIAPAVEAVGVDGHG